MLFRSDYGGHVSVMLPAQWLGLRVFGRQGASFLGHRVRDGHYGGAPLWGGQSPESDDARGWQNYRLEVRLVDGAPEGELSVLGRDGKWVVKGRGRFQDGRQEQGALLVPPPLQKIELSGRNGTAGFIDAVAVAIGR